MNHAAHEPSSSHECRRHHAYRQIAALPRESRPLHGRLSHPWDHVVRTDASFRPPTCPFTPAPGRLTGALTWRYTTEVQVALHVGPYGGVPHPLLLGVLG